MSYKIPFINPTLPPSADVRDDYEKIHENNYYTNNGDFYFAFKKQVEDYLGDGSHVSIVANATLGLLMSMRITTDRSKKYVLVPSFTFAAGPLSIMWAGHEPLFIDIEQETLQPSITQAREILSQEPENIAAILLCNSFGVGNSEIDQWEKLAQESGVPLVIDSAAGFGSRYDENEYIGMRGDCEIFSLHATKPFGIGEGGIVCSRDGDFIAKIESLKNFGFNSQRAVDTIGLNAKISEMSCALGLRLLPTLNNRIARRQEIFNEYVKQTSSYGVSFIENAEHSSLCFASLILPPEWSKQALMALFEREDVEVRDYYNPPVSAQKAFLNCRSLDLKNTDDLTTRMISLPISEKLTDENVALILNVIHNYAR